MVLCNTVETATSQDSTPNGTAPPKPPVSTSDDPSKCVTRDSSPGLNSLKQDTLTSHKNNTPQDLSMHNKGQSSSVLQGQSSSAPRPIDHGIEIKQVEFDSIGETCCSVTSPDLDLGSIKVTMPTNETVLLTGLQNSTQVLVHNRVGQHPSNEPLSSRIFTSQHSMDVAEVAAVLSTPNGTRGGKNISGDKHEHQSSQIQDKFKPMKKRSLTDLLAGTSWDDYEFQPKKQKQSDAITQVPDYISSTSAPSNFNQSISVKAHMPIISHTSVAQGYPTSLSDKSQSRNSSGPLNIQSSAFGLPRQMKIKSEPKY